MSVTLMQMKSLRKKTAKKSQQALLLCKTTDCTHTPYTAT